MVGGPPTFVVSGKPKAGKSCLVNALLGMPELSPTDALEATATALYVSSGTAAEAETGIRVHRRGRVDTEERDALVEKYTGRDAEEVKKIEIQTASRFFLNVQFIDTPGFGAQGAFGARHDEIAEAEIETADVRIHLLTNASDARRLNARPHQPLIVVRSHSDRLIDMTLTSNNDAFRAFKKEKEQFEASLSPGRKVLYCAPLIAIGAEALEDSILEEILTLSESESECLQFLLSRGCLTENPAYTPLTLSERQELISEMSKTLLPRTSRYGAWSFFRCALLLSRYYEAVDDVEKLREMLIRFSGIREVRRAVRDLSEPSFIRRVRIKRLLTEKLKILQKTSEVELACLREDISAFAIALDAALCEMTDVGNRVLERLREQETHRSTRIIRYERSLAFLEQEAFSAGEPSDLDLTWILENDTLNALDRHEQKEVISFLVEDALKIKKGDAINGSAKVDEHDV